MKELVEKVAALYADFSKDANAQIENGNKAAGTRARTPIHTSSTTGKPDNMVLPFGCSLRTEHNT